MSVRLSSSIFRALLLAVALLLSAPAVVAATARPVWEEVSTEVAPQDLDFDSDGRRDNVEIDLRDGKIYIYSDKAVKVEIFTILGQLVTTRQVKPGITRLTLGQRGIYILKAGATARRINI